MCLILCSIVPAFGFTLLFKSAYRTPPAAFVSWARSQVARAKQPIAVRRNAVKVGRAFVSLFISFINHLSIKSALRPTNHCLQCPSFKLPSPFAQAAGGACPTRLFIKPVTFVASPFKVIRGPFKRLTSFAA